MQRYLIIYAILQVSTCIWTVCFTHQSSTQYFFFCRFSLHDCNELGDDVVCVERGRRKAVFVLTFLVDVGLWLQTSAGVAGLAALSEAAHKSVSSRLVSHLRRRRVEVGQVVVVVVVVVVVLVVVFVVVDGRSGTGLDSQCSNVSQPSSATVRHHGRYDGVETCHVDAVPTAVFLTHDKRCQPVSPEDIWRQIRRAHLCRIPRWLDNTWQNYTVS